jgi:hypothetical protein
MGEGGSVTLFELSRFWGHEISLNDDVRCQWNNVHQLNASTIPTPMTTRHMSVDYSITTHPRVLSSQKDVLIQWKHLSLYSLWMKIMNDVSRCRPYMTQPSIGISYGQ